MSPRPVPARGSAPAGDGRAAEDGRTGAASLLPSAVTVLAVCLGLSAIRFALDGELGSAYFLVLAAAVLDAVDGRIARLLDVSSRIGAELDSLADAISFGVAPALVLYLTLLQGSRGGWVVSLIFVVCTVLRLARFNTLLDDSGSKPGAADEDSSPTAEFFTGVPSPSGAMVALLPLAVTLQLGDGWWADPALVSVWMLATAGLVISRLPTLSVGAIRVRRSLAGPFLVLVGAVIAGLIVFPYVSVSLLTFVYLGHLPLAARRHREALARAVPRHPTRVPRARPSARRLGLRPPRVRRAPDRPRRTRG